MARAPHGRELIGLLSQRALNRATLDRQHLLRRSSMSALDLVEHLAGLQAQNTHSWYVGLWTRLEDFDPVAMGRDLTERRVVRIAAMRSTIHLLTPDDCLRMRPLVQPAIERSTNGSFGRRLVGIDRAELMSVARALVEEEPRTFTELGALLRERWPERDAASLAQAARMWLPLVQVPPRGVWGASGLARHTTAQSWLGRELDETWGVDQLVLRYLAAYGPASVLDIQAWCGLTKLREVTDRLGSRLVVLRDAQGRELVDLPEAPRPDPDTPATVRYLPELDNLLLSYADRGRFASHPPPEGYWTEHGPTPGAILVDGVVTAGWMLSRERRAVTMTVSSWSELSAEQEAELQAEGNRLLEFLAPDADTRVLRRVELS